MPTYVSLAEFARDRGVKRQSVHEWAKKYAIPLVDGKLDLEVARVQWDVHRKRRTARAGGDEPKGDGAKSGGGSDYWASKTRREEAEAKLAELKLAEMAGTLVLREEVDRTLFLAARVMRDQMLSIAPRLAAPLAAIADPKAIELRIGEDIRIALQAFARTLRDGGLVDVEHERPV